MKKLLITLLVIISQFTIANSGFEDYTYRKDRPFNNIRQLQGQTFVPQEYSDGTLGKTFVEAGKVKIHIGNSMVHIEGLPQVSNFNIVAASTTRVGYEFKLMDGRGYHTSKMKVVLDRKNFVELVYLYSRKYGEYTFFLPSKTQRDIEKERSYFSHKKSVVLESMEDLTDVSLVPYQQIVGINNPSSVKEKISMKKQLKVKFGTKYVTVSSASGKQNYKMKKSKVAPVSLTDYPKVTEVWEIRTNNKKNNIQLFLNKANEIDFFEINNTRYSLL